MGPAPWFTPAEACQTDVGQAALCEQPADPRGPGFGDEGVAILNKPGPLDEREWEFMRQHTIVGERIVASASSLGDVASIVRSSHERWDGAGYPDRLASEAIPLGARIIAVCDAYDAMTTTRPYRRAMSDADAMAELRRCAGRQFDPHVVTVFERVAAQERAAELHRLAA